MSNNFSNNYYFSIALNSRRSSRKKITGEPPEGTLNIESAIAKDDDGIYICVAKNELQTITQSVYVRVKGLLNIFL